MFFTPDLLAKRDSGFGLLWLAATLGSKSAFKKIPKRSVMTADITELCDLISQPAEPLALRLSSNLMFGVVRVYKVKQDIFMTDVTNCVTSLKKVVQELNSKAIDARLQLAHTSVRPSAITIRPDARAAHTIVDYEAFVTDWDEYLNIGPDDRDFNEENEDEDEYDPKARKAKPASKGKPASHAEVARDAHTLEEHHEHLFTASFDQSFIGNLPGFPGGSNGDFSSTQEPAMDMSFGGENMFAFSDGLELGDILGLGEDLAREIGWASPEKQRPSRSPMSSPGLQAGFGIGDVPDFNFDVEMGDDLHPFDHQAPEFLNQTPAAMRRTPENRAKSQNKENNYPGLVSRQPSVIRDVTPGTAFATQLLSQDLNIDSTHFHDAVAPNEAHPKDKAKKKRTRLLLDARIELTDEELKSARAKYLYYQKSLRREVLMKRAEKNGDRLIDEYVWAAPKGIFDQGLSDFWKSTFKVQVDARSGAVAIHDDEEEEEDARPKAKRRKTISPHKDINEGVGDDFAWEQDADMGMLVDDMMQDPPMDDALGYDRRSSEDPGQGRHLSRPSSVFGGSNLGIEAAVRPVQGSGSQRSSLFPWDHAGAGSSSSGNIPFRANDEIAVHPVDIHLRGSSQVRRSSGLASQRSRDATPQSGPGCSPIPIRLPSPSQNIGEDYEFNVPEDQEPKETQAETQKSDGDAIVLEKNSFNFLEYARMQSRTLADPAGKLSFDTVVPPDTSTRHVAAAAFHHCLVLATKHLIRVEQEEPYSAVFMSII